MNSNNLNGYDEQGNPVDYIDEKNSVKWKYQGKEKDGSDHWMGIPFE